MGMSGESKLRRVIKAQLRLRRLGNSLRFPEVQRSNLIGQLNWLLKRELDEEELPFDRAFSHIALDILGYDLDSGTMSDGKGDFGIDYWIVDEKAATIFQFKSHDFTETLNPNFAADPKYLADLPRIQNLLTHLNEIPAEANAKVQDFVKELRSSVHRYSLTAHATDAPFEITIFFCCLAKRLTDQADEEFRRLGKDKNIPLGDQTLHVAIIPIMIDDLIAERWRESNTDWRTSSGQRDDKIELHVRGEMISSAKSAVFFTKAYDLVAAFDPLRIPNVRTKRPLRIEAIESE